MSTDDKKIQEKALRMVLSNLLSEGWNKSAPEIGTKVHRIVKKITGKVDPYWKLKRKVNQMAADLYPKLKHIVEASTDPLFTAVKVAISGNAIDFGPKIEINIEEEVQHVLESELAINDFDKLRESTLRYGEVLYLADNAGETYFDKILIEELTELGVEVTYVVKGDPILNDATFEDAEETGITGIARVVSTGTDCMGIIFDECSKDFIEEFENSPLVISKGQGNYESLNEIKNKEIFFLLKAKCPIIAEDLDVKIGSTVLKGLI